MLRVEKVKERYSIMISIEKTKGVITITSIKMNSLTLIFIKPYVFIMFQKRLASTGASGDPITTPHI